MGMKKNKIWFRGLAAMMAFAVAVTGLPTAIVKADSTDNEKYLSLGADLNAKEKTKVLELLGVSSSNDYTILSVTNQEEHAYLDDYLSNSVIGSRALSSAVVEKTDDGDGINVETANISYCTEGMYRNALATAGIENAKIKVAGPFQISGTAALVGVMKAYEDMTGKKISEKSKDAATDELITTGEISDSIGKDDAEKLIADVKQKVAQEDLSSVNDIGEAIDDSAKKLEINLSSADRQKIIELMQKISSLDLNVSQLKEQAQAIYDKLSSMNSSGILDKISNWFQSLIEQLKSLF